MGLFDALFGKKKMSLENADRKNDEFIAKNPASENDENEMMRKASKLMTSEKFEESLELYQKLSNDYPNKRGLYESQVGAAYFFLGEYEKAVEHYISSMNNGGDKDMMDDNIWEAAEAYSNLEILTEDGSVISPKGLVEKYLELFPNGSYAKKARKILDK